MDSLRDLGNAAVKKHPGIEDAVAYMRRWLRGHPDSLADWLDDAIITTALKHVVYAARGTMKHVLKANGKQNDPRPSNLSAHAFLTKCVLDTFNTDLGRVVGDLTGKECRVLAEKERGQSVGHDKNARWYDALADLTPEDELVRQHVKGNRARTLFLSIYGSAVDAKLFEDAAG